VVQIIHHGIERAGTGSEEFAAMYRRKDSPCRSFSIKTLQRGVSFTGGRQSWCDKSNRILLIRKKFFRTFEQHSLNDKSFHAANE